MNGRENGEVHEDAARAERGGKCDLLAAGGDADECAGIHADGECAGGDGDGGGGAGGLIGGLLCRRLSRRTRRR